MADIAAAALFRRNEDARAALRTVVALHKGCAVVHPARLYTIRPGLTFAACPCCGTSPLKR